MNIFNEGMLHIADQYERKFDRKISGLRFLISIGRFKSIRDTLIAVERIMINKKQCTPIEELPHNEKLDLWNLSKRLCPGGSEKLVIEVCKALNGFGSYLKSKQ